MTALVLVAVALTLLAGFLALTRYELVRGSRVYAPERERFDAFVERIEYVLEHVNILAFLQDELRHFAARVGHEFVRVTLVVVRAVERLLTRLIRHLRTHPEIDPAPRETAREFVKTLSDFKDTLQATHPEISDIPSEEAPR